MYDEKIKITKQKNLIQKLSDFFSIGKVCPVSPIGNLKNGKNNERMEHSVCLQRCFGNNVHLCTKIKINKPRRNEYAIACLHRYNIVKSIKKWIAGCVKVVYVTNASCYLNFKNDSPQKRFIEFSDSVFFEKPPTAIPLANLIIRKHSKLHEFIECDIYCILLEHGIRVDYNRTNSKKNIPNDVWISPKVGLHVVRH